MTTTVTDSTPHADEWTIDELARRADLPVRTIREYQTLGLLPSPRRRGRVGYYGRSHRRRLELIARLRERGHSLAGIADLLGRWSDGADLGEVLGLDPDQLVHVDEPGAPASLEQLSAALPALVPDRLDALAATGAIEPNPDGVTFCVPSPSLLQLAIDASAAGITPDRVLAMLATIGVASDTIADDLVAQLADLPPDIASSMLRRGRGLLAHGVGRLTLHRIGIRLGISDEADVEPALRRVAQRNRKRSR